MGKILVSGLVNIETSVKVDSFPVEYCPIEYPFFGVKTCVSGVGYNVAKALKTLGSDVGLISVIGDDLAGDVVRREIEKAGLDSAHLLVDEGSETAESAVLVNEEGKRKIYCDLKNLQMRSSFTENDIDVEPYSLLALTNINYNRCFLDVAKVHGKLIATDVHVLSKLDDPYNRKFMECADILFLSNEMILGRESEVLQGIYEKYHNKILVCGCGEKGALMYLGEENRFVFEPAIAPYGVVSTVGAGDALFSAFIHFFNKGKAPAVCLKKAVWFAGIKISQDGGSNGFVGEDQL